MPHVDGSDDNLMAAIREALREKSAVPAGAAESAYAIFETHDLDSELELLTLLYDSARDVEQLTRASRSFVAARYLTFQRESISLEVEIRPDALLGQIIPAQTATVSLVTPSGTACMTETDELGLFYLDRPQEQVVRLTCTTASTKLQTTWISMRSETP